MVRPPLRLIASSLNQCGHRRLDAHPICFGFERVILDDCHTIAERIADAARLLLDDMPQFMAEQFLALNRVRVVLTGSEMDVRAPRIGYRADGGRLLPDVDAHIGE